MNVDKIIKIKQVKEIVGFSPSTIRRLQKTGQFPAPITIPGTTRKGWSLLQINEYVEKIKSQTQAPVLAHAKTWRTNNKL